LWVVSQAARGKIAVHLID